MPHKQSVNKIILSAVQKYLEIPRFGNNANITITGQTKEMNVKSISGYIDLTEPPNKQADIDFSTISGRMYSNHELALSKLHSGIPLKITERLNNGGDPIKLETISGDIFFRKSN